MSHITWCTKGGMAPRCQARARPTSRTKSPLTRYLLRAVSVAFQALNLALTARGEDGPTVDFRPRLAALAEPGAGLLKLTYALVDAAEFAIEVGVSSAWLAYARTMASPNLLCNTWLGVVSLDAMPPSASANACLARRTASFPRPRATRDSAMVVFKTMEFARYRVLAAFLRSSGAFKKIGLLELRQTSGCLPLLPQYRSEPKFGAGQVETRLFIGWVLSNEPLRDDDGLPEHFRGAGEIAQMVARAKAKHVADMTVGNHELALVYDVLAKDLLVPQRTRRPRI